MAAALRTAMKIEGKAGGPILVDGKPICDLHPPKKSKTATKATKKGGKK